MAISLLLLSGGLDSATALAVIARDSSPCHALFFSYGQAARCEEEHAARALASHYAVPITTVQIAGASFGCGEIRGRNAFLIHSAVLVAPAGSATIVTAIHGGTSYVDCSPEFVELMQRSLALNTRGEITLAAPFLDYSKGDIYLLARRLSVPIELTYSCERGGEPCRECLSCLDSESLSALA